MINSGFEIKTGGLYLVHIRTAFIRVSFNLHVWMCTFELGYVKY